MQDWMNSYAPDIPAEQSPPPSTVNMWSGEAPQSQPSPYPTSSPAPQFTPPDVPGFNEPTPIPTYGEPNPSTIATGQYPPGSITDIPGGNEPLADLPSPPGVSPDVLPAEQLTGNEPGATPPITETTGIPAPEFAPDNLYGPPGLYAGANAPNSWNQPTDWPGFFGGISNLFNSIGGIFSNIFSSNPFPGIAPSGFPVGSNTPDAIARSYALPGSFTNLGGAGGSLAGSQGNAIASTIARNLARTGQGTTVGYPAFAQTFRNTPGATMVGPQNYAYGQEILNRAAPRRGISTSGSWVVGGSPKGTV